MQTHYGFFVRPHSFASIMDLGSRNIVLGVCGSIAAYKAPLIVRLLVKAGANVHVIMTPSARQFVSPLVLENLSRNPVAIEMFNEDIQEGGSWHIHRARQCDLMLVAPASAHSIAAMAHGLSDSALSCVALALKPETPLFIAPAMDTEMWEHPATQANCRILEKRGAVIIPPSIGELASGSIGAGRMPEAEELVRFIQGESLVSPIRSDESQAQTSAAEQSSRPLEQTINDDKLRTDFALHELKSKLFPDAQNAGSLQGATVLISAGPTREAIDDVRYLSNYSSGKMGYALASAAHAAGANVVLVSGPVNLETPPGVQRVSVESAQQMHDACMQYSSSYDVAIMAAAVADFTPATQHSGKLKKSEMKDGLRIELVQTKDILAQLGQQKSSRQILVGFALESSQELEYATTKLNAKNCDMIITNSSRKGESVIAKDDTRVTILQRTAEGVSQEDLQQMSKEHCAQIIINRVMQRRKDLIASGKI